MLGYHAKSPYNKSIREGLKNGIKTFQVMCSSPQRFEPPRPDVIMASVSSPIEKLLVHGPYWANISKDMGESIVQGTFKYYKLLSQYLQLLGPGRSLMVTHVGSRGTSSYENSVNYMKTWIEKWLKATESNSSILCLENDAGSRNGCKMGNLDLLSDIVKEFNSPRLGICIDTEHAYANGVKLSDLVNYLQYTRAVHLNAIPSNVKFGEHLDRHSETLLRDSKDGTLMELLAFVESIPNSIPIVLERADTKIALQDVEYLRSLYDTF